jgi:hypothetical protein
MKSQKSTRVNRKGACEKFHKRSAAQTLPCTPSKGWARLIQSEVGDSYSAKLVKQLIDETPEGEARHD